jgi:tetratricopeptide (TPR) repeat protein
MKSLYTIITILLLSPILSKAQDRVTRAQQLTCGCLDSLKALPFKTRTDSCFSKSIATALFDGSKKGEKIPSTVEGIRGYMALVKKAVYDNCPDFRQAYNEDAYNAFDSLSANEQANDFYRSGNKLLTAEKYDEAIPYYEKALKLDPKFLFAIDNLAVCYRKKNDYATALKYYQKSLAIFPAANMALLNTAVAYGLSKNNDEALNYYAKLRYYYPNDPEGYFGVAKMCAFSDKYEEALDNIFIAHKLYANAQSPYLKDSNTLVTYIYQQMKEKNMLEIFNRKAKQYNININSN